MSQTPRPSLPEPPGPRVLPEVDVPRVESLEAVGAQVSRHLARCRRHGGRLSVLWLEALPQVRPGSAWPAGARQAMMKALSRRLRNRVRGSDEVLQVGEDSFAVMLLLAGQAEAAVVEERLRQALKGSYGVDGLLMHSDLNIGSASFPEVGRNGPDLTEHARQSCFAAGAKARLLPPA